MPAVHIHSLRRKFGTLKLAISKALADRRNSLAIISSGDHKSLANNTDKRPVTHLTKRWKEQQKERVIYVMLKFVIVRHNTFVFWFSYCFWSAKSVYLTYIPNYSDNSIFSKTETCWHVTLVQTNFFSTHLSSCVKINARHYLASAFRINHAKLPALVTLLTAEHSAFYQQCII